MKSKLLTSIALVAALILGITSLLVTMPAPALAIAPTQAPRQEVVTNIEQTIRENLKQEGASPTELKISQVTVDGDYALVGWTWGEDSGETALLYDDRGSWQIMLSQQGTLDLNQLTDEAVFPPEVAQRIIEQRSR